MCLNHTHFEKASNLVLKNLTKKFKNISVLLLLLLPSCFGLCEFVRRLERHAAEARHLREKAAGQ